MFAGLLQKITGDEEDADDGFVNINDESDDTDVHEQIKSERRRCAFDLNLPIKPLLPFPPSRPLFRRRDAHNVPWPAGREVCRGRPLPR